MDQLTALSQEVRRLQRMVRLLATRATVTLSDSSDFIQRLQLDGLGDEVLDSIEHIEPYGFTSRPLDGAEAILANLFANRDHAVAVLVGDRRFRLKNMEKGEVALWTDEGDVIHFQRGNKILIDSANEVTVNASTSATVTSPLVNVVASTKCTIDSPATEITGNLQVGGTAAVTGALSSATSVADPTGTMQSMRTTYNSHTHKENDNAGQTDATGQTM